MLRHRRRQHAVSLCGPHPREAVVASQRRALEFSAHGAHPPGVLAGEEPAAERSRRRPWHSPRRRAHRGDVDHLPRGRSRCGRPGGRPCCLSPAAVRRSQDPAMIAAGSSGSARFSTTRSLLTIDANAPEASCGGSSPQRQSMRRSEETGRPCSRQSRTNASRPCRPGRSRSSTAPQSPTTVIRPQRWIRSTIDHQSFRHRAGVRSRKRETRRRTPWNRSSSVRVAPC